MHTILLECFKIGKVNSGSEAGIARAWLEVLLSIETIEEIHVFTSSIQEPPLSNKVKIHLVDKFTLPIKNLHEITEKHLGPANALSEFIFKANYCHWLQRVISTAKNTQFKTPPTLAIHGSYCTLFPGTNLKKLGIPTVLCHGAKHRINEQWIHKIRGWKPDVISCPNKSESEKNNWVFLKDPFFPPKKLGLEKKNQILYIDHLPPRKGAVILKNELREIQKEGKPLPPILILTDRPIWWGHIPTSPKVSKEAYIKLLESSTHLLNTSSRESSCTSVMDACFLNTQIIANPLEAFETIPPELFIPKMERIDKVWNKLKETTVKTPFKEPLEHKALNMGLNPARALITRLLWSPNKN